MHSLFGWIRWLFLSMGVWVLCGCPARENPLKELPLAQIQRTRPAPVQRIRPIAQTRRSKSPVSKRRAATQPVRRRTSSPSIPKGAIRRSRRGFRGGVFHENKQAPHPLAVRLCNALHVVPKQRRKICCKDKFMLFHPGQECIRTLTASLRKKHIRLSSQRVQACEAALHRVYAGCDWIGAREPRTPAACQGLFEGLRKKGMSCRSALECPKGMYCHGLGSTTPGRCWTQLPEGMPCGRGIDPLAVYTRQDQLDRFHPQCKGYCVRTRCRNPRPLGKACSADMHCGAAHHCAKGRCAKGWFARKGQPCDSWCEEGTRCIQGLCQTPRSAGMSCSKDAECRGGCVFTKGQKQGACAMQCAWIRR